MRTAVISDLHLGSSGGEDLLHDAAIRDLLWREIKGCDRVILLGDAVELRDRPIAEALELARPFFTELGGVVGDGGVVLVPGNHDHRFAEPLLDQVALSEEGTLGLEQRTGARDGAIGKISDWLGHTELEVAYPGLWLRNDVYAMHGHYMDCHLTLPRAECLAANVLMRISDRPPDPAEPMDYERVLRPLYGLIFGLAQSGGAVAGSAARASERAWRYTRSAGGGTPSGGRLAKLGAAATARAAVPAAVWALNRALRSDLTADLSPASITRGALAAATETVRRLGIGADHVIVGHTHRGGPRETDDPWRLSNGNQLHNTGNWVFTRVLHRPGTRPGPYWPGTVTWVDDEGAPRRVRLLDDHRPEDLGAIARGGRFTLAALASEQTG